MKGYDRLSDRELAAAAQGGDTFAEGELVKRYAQLAEGISRSYRLVGGDGDDLKQIALIALLDAVRSAAAGKNAVLNDSLRIDDESAREGGVAISDIVSPELSPEQQYIAKEAEEAFFEALGEVLGERDLTVIRLYLACVPYKEISERLGISAKKVDNTIYNAKKKIARLIADAKKD